LILTENFCWLHNSGGRNKDKPKGAQGDLWAFTIYFKLAYFSITITCADRLCVTLVGLVGIQAQEAPGSIPRVREVASFLCYIISASGFPFGV
jgi:hypothetical protein